MSYMLENVKISLFFTAECSQVSVKAITSDLLFSKKEEIGSRFNNMLRILAYDSDGQVKIGNNFGAWRLCAHALNRSYLFSGTTALAEPSQV